MNAFTQMGRFALTVVLSVFAAFSASAQSAPYAHTQAAGPITATNATLNGMVVPNGADTVAWFEWGTNGLYSETTTPVSVGNGTMVVPCTATASNLAMGMLYQCRLVASNDLGVAIGAPRLFSANGDALGWGTNSSGQADIYPDANTDMAITAGQYHTLTLRNDGTVNAVGRFDSYTPVYVPDGLSSVVAIGSGWSHCLAVRSDGTVAAWGLRATNVPVGLSNVIAVAGGQYHSLALIRDGTVAQWGGFSPVPAGLSNVVAIAAGQYLNLALRADGTIVSWGQNSSVFAGVSNVTAIAVGGGISGVNVAYAVKVDGTVTNSAWPSPPSGLSNVVAVAIGTSHVLALRVDGSVVAWGQNIYGQTNVPVAASNCVAIAAGEQHSAAISIRLVGPCAAIPQVTFSGTSVRFSGFVVPNGLASDAWFEWWLRGAQNTNSTPRTEVGDGSQVVYHTAEIPIITDRGAHFCRLVVSNAAGVVAGAPMLFSSNGDALAWGSDYYGQMEIYPDDNADVAISAGLHHSLTLRKDGTVSAVGFFSSDGSSGAAYVPADLTNVVTIGSSAEEYAHCLAVRSDGTVAAWGAKEVKYATNIPPGLSNVIMVAANFENSFALRKDGMVVAWGYNSYGLTNVPAGLRNVVAIAAGKSCVLALRADGKVVSWGQLSVPMGLNNVIAVAAGELHGMALKSDGTVRVWGGLGFNNYGQGNVPIDLSNVVAIAAGRYDSMALRADGTVVAWGQNTYGQTNVPVAASNCVAIAAGADHSVAISAQLARPRAAIPSATHITATTARLGGFVTPNGLLSLAWFEWWERGSFVTNITSAESVGDGTAVVYQTADLVGLVQGGIYHCRSVISNEAGVAIGPPGAFTTGQKIIAWGDNGNGQVAVPPGLSNVVSVAAGQGHAVAIMNDGTLVGWGSNNYGETVFPPEATNVIALATGYSHTVALREDGTVIAWGLNSYGQATVPEGLSNVVAIAANGQNSLALKSGGMAVVWGLLSGYQPLLTNVTAISAANFHGIAVREDGVFQAFGFSVPPQYLPVTGDCVSIVGNDVRSLGLLRDGGLTVSLFGYAPPADLTNVLSIAVSSSSFYGLEMDGTVHAWGQNVYGSTDVPPGLSNAVSVTSCFATAYAIGPDVPYIIASGTVIGYVNADLPISLPAHDPNGDPLTFRIASLPAEGSLYQYDSGVRGAAITALDAAVTDPSGRVIFAPDFDGVGSPYTTFNFTVNDGVADSAPAAVTVNIVLPPVPQIVSTNSGWRTNAPGAFELNFTGTPNAVYSAYASTNLVDWERLGLATQVTNGVFQFLDLGATNWPHRFYRAGAP